MRTFKGWITTTCLVAMLMVSTMTANAGIIIGGAVEPCTDAPTTKVGKIDYGIIIGGLGANTGIIIGGLAGIIIGGLAADESVVNCGIIIGG